MLLIAHLFVFSAIFQNPASANQQRQVPFNPETYPTYHEQANRTKHEKANPFSKTETLYVLNLAIGCLLVALLYLLIMKLIVEKGMHDENIDTVPMTTPIACHYTTSTSFSIKEAMENEGLSDYEEYRQFFIQKFDIDSKRSGAHGSMSMAQEYGADMRFNNPVVLHSLVTLSGYGSRFDNDFLNANFVEFPSGLRYVLAEGPQIASATKKSTIVKYYWMMKQCEMSNVVMLCPFEENGVVQCDRYFPNSVNETFEDDGLLVTCLSLEYKFDKIIEIRTLSVQLRDCKKFTITHYHYLGWKDGWTPSRVEHLWALLIAVKTDWKPVLVHCSDGIGRSGVMAYIELCYQRLSRQWDIDLDKILDCLRSQRCGAVSNNFQYSFSSFFISYYAFKQVMWHFTSNTVSDSYHYLKDGYLDYRETLEAARRRPVETADGTPKNTAKVEVEPVKKTVEKPATKIQKASAETVPKVVKKEEKKDAKTEVKKVKSEKKKDVKIEVKKVKSEVKKEEKKTKRSKKRK